MIFVPNANVGDLKRKFINTNCLTFIISYFNKQTVQGLSYELVNVIHNLIYFKSQNTLIIILTSIQQMITDTKN